MSFGLSLSSMAFLQISRFLRRSLFGGLLEVGVPGPVRRRPLPCEGEVEIRRVPEPAEYATLSPKHEDYLRAQIATDEFPARGRSIRRRPTLGRLAPCGN
jgi:hypothetical protein